MSPYQPVFCGGGGGVRKLSLLFALPLLCWALALAGCEHDAEDSGVLTGTWKYSYEYEETTYVMEIRITSNSINYVGSYEGKIVNSPNFGAPYGVLIIEFTKYADFGGTPSTTHSNVGKFGAMYWKDLTSDSVYLSDAGTGGMDNYQHTMFGTLEDARATFTNDATSTYANFSTPYSK